MCCMKVLSLLSDIFTAIVAVSFVKNAKSAKISWKKNDFLYAIESTHKKTFKSF